MGSRDLQTVRSAPEQTAPSALARADADAPLLSIIIPFKNEAPTLPLVLDSLLVQQADFPCEVIFGDGCSTDASVEIIRNHPLARRMPVSIVALPPDNHGMTVARNVCAGKARGRYLLFMQADVRITDPLALVKTVRTMETPGVVCSTFVELQADAEFAKFDFWGQVFQARYLGSRTPNAFDTKFNAVPRDVFEKLRGFDDQRFAWGGEDFDFLVRLRQFGEIKDTGVEVEHIHGLGKPFTALGTLKKYCRNSECMGITAPVYWRHRDLAPGYPRFLAQQLFVCAVALTTLVPPWWPWPFLLLTALGVWWNKAAFLHVRNWRLVWLPFYSVAALYCFTFYFLRGLLSRKSSYAFDNKM